MSLYILDIPYRLKILLNFQLERVICFLLYNYSYKYIEICAVFKDIVTIEKIPKLKDLHDF